MLFDAIIRVMSSAIAGLIGAAIGAIAGIAGTLVTQILQIRAERKQALRTKREEAYKNALQYLQKIRDRRVADLRRVIWPAYYVTGDPDFTEALKRKLREEEQKGKDRFTVLVGDITAFREEAFDDIVGARLWLTSATAYSSPMARSSLLDSIDALETFATSVLEGEVAKVLAVPEVANTPRFLDTIGLVLDRKTEAMLWSEKYDRALENTYKTVLRCAQDDLRDSYK